jgi:oxygen-independent coproporphyrinogen-3 oxidase
MRDEFFLDDKFIYYAYIQIPFCKSRCSYCHWSTKYNDDILSIDRLRKPFVEALKKEIRLRSRFAPERGKVTLQVIHFGGGTPSLLTVVELQDILNALLHAYGQRIENLQKVAIEARPDSLSYEKVRDLKALGFNRISIGLQTFNQRVLDRVQRHVDVEQCFRSFDWIRSVGFEDVSIDMLYGLPHQTFEDVKRDMEIVLRLKPDHIDAYPWNPEDTAFAKNAEMFAETEKNKKIAWASYIKKTLEENGYDNYCHVCYAQPGKENIMQLISANYLLPYLGFGPGAEYIFDTHHAKNIIDIGEYIDHRMGATHYQYPEVRRSAQLNEMFNIIIRHLRLDEGIDLDYFNRRYHLDLEKFLLSYKDPEYLQKEAAREEYNDRALFLEFANMVKNLRKVQEWLETGILEKNGKYLRVKDEFKISGETWDDMYKG